MNASAMRIVRLGNAQELVALKAEINALNLASARPDPFSTCEFYVNFLENGDWHNDHARPQLHFLAAFRNEQLIGYLALKEVTRRGWLRRSRRVDFLVGHEADRPHVVARPEHLTEVSENFYAYLATQRDWDFLELQQQEEGSSLYRPPSGVRFRRCWVAHFPTWDNCTIPLHWKTVQEYVGSMSRNMRSALKRRLRALLALGEIELIVSSDPRSTPALFKLYCDIESRSWKSKTNIAVGGNTLRTRYFEALLDPRQPMQIVIHLLLLDGEPIAGLLCGSYASPSHKGLYGLHIAFDSRLSAVSPGSAILLMAVRYAIEQGYAFFNLLSGFGYYKTRWLAQATPTASVQIYRVGSLLFMRRVCGNLKRALTRRGANLLPRRARPDRDRQSRAETRLKPRPNPRVAVEDRTRYDALIAHALRGQTNYVSAPELKAGWSFMLSRAPAAPHVSRRGKTAMRTKTPHESSLTTD